MALQLTERENTLEIFDNFYSQSLNVNASEWDSVYSYFLGVLKGNPESASVKKTASQFATVLFQISQETGTNIQQVFEGKKQGLYGVSNVPTPNQAVQRNVIP